MPPIPCVLYDLYPMYRLYLRRFIMEDRCPHVFADGYERCCNAMALLEDRPLEKDGRGCLPSLSHDRSDPLWPKHCEHCGREFLPEHQWQVHIDHLYREPQSGAVLPLAELPVGAMWLQDFGHGPNSRFILERAVKARGPDALVLPERERIPHLFVRTPGGAWDMDTIARNGDGWELTGVPPKITAHPSIQHTTGNHWHGWLREGVLTEC